MPRIPNDELARLKTQVSLLRLVESQGYVVTRQGKSDVALVGAVATGGTSAVVGIPGKILAKVGKRGLRKLSEILRDKAVRRQAGPCSFVAGTMVATPSGVVAIEELEARRQYA